MQQYKKHFSDLTIKEKTICNIQSCLRLNDLNEIGDGSHYLYFKMMGLFSFRDWTVKDAIKFWMNFLSKLKIKPDYITIHPDKITEWSEWYKEYDIEIKQDTECIWSDGGSLNGYCTEFYKDGLEIGNIVNIHGDCIDVGFGLERLDSIVNKKHIKNKIEVLQLTIHKMIECGFIPSNKEHGYVLRKLINELRKNGGSIIHHLYDSEFKRYEKCKERYLKLKPKYPDKDAKWWNDTHGINLEDI